MLKIESRRRWEGTLSYRATKEARLPGPEVVGQSEAKEQSSSGSARVGTEVSSLAYVDFVLGQNDRPGKWRAKDETGVGKKYVQALYGAPQSVRQFLAAMLVELFPVSKVSGFRPHQTTSMGPERQSKLFAKSSADPGLWSAWGPRPNKVFFLEQCLLKCIKHCQESGCQDSPEKVASVPLRIGIECPLQIRSHSTLDTISPHWDQWPAFKPVDKPTPFLELRRLLGTKYELFPFLLCSFFMYLLSMASCS